MHTCSLNKHNLRQIPPAWNQDQSTPTLIVVGEAPAATEDLIGIPFVGRCGLFLRKLLRSYKVDERYSISYINSICCKLPDNRPPTSSEINEHVEYFKTEMNKHKGLILALGKTAQEMLRLSGYGENQYVTAPHPSYAMRNKKALEELKQALIKLNGIVY